MKALTVWQPWGTLLVRGLKQNETRSWRTNYRGEVLIHASKKSFYECWFRYLDDSARSEICSLMNFGETFNWERYFPTGAILGKATLIECRKIDEEYSGFLKTKCPQEYILGDYTPGRFAWVFKDPLMFNDLVPASGKQGLWNWETEVRNG